MQNFGSIIFYVQFQEDCCGIYIATYILVLKVKYFDRLVDKLYNLKWITAKDADEAKKEYFKFITPVQNEHKDAFLTFDEFDELTFV